MGTFNECITIHADPAAVWDTLADIGTIADWNPGLQSSRSTNNQAGAGATRHCVISDKHWLDEEVVDYAAGERIAFSITDSTMPFAQAVIRFTLAATDAGTEVCVSPAYRLKYRIVGQAIDVVFVRRTYRAGMRGLLGGLKTHSEQRTDTTSRQR